MLSATTSFIKDNGSTIRANCMEKTVKKATLFPVVWSKIQIPVTGLRGL